MSIQQNLDKLIKPHGGKLVKTLKYGNELKDCINEAKTLDSVNISSREFGDLVMMGIGGFSPLDGFMKKEDWYSVCKNFTMADGTFWPIPITMSVSEDEAKKMKRGKKVALKYPGDVNEISGTIEVDEIYEMTKKDKEMECQDVFTTTDSEHPGVKKVMQQKPFNVAGKVTTLSEGDFPTKYKGIYMTPEESRLLFAKKGWNTIAALQLRNPMHRSHEYLAKLAVEVCDGVFVHSLVGNLKPGDIPAEVRVKCIDALVKNYFIEKNVLQGGYPLDMRYAGPREALLHATFRQNYGCTHMIIGRDHAGVGDYYGPFDAQKIFDKIPTNADPKKRLLTQPLKIDWTFYCHKCDGMASLRTCPHTKKDRVIVSGTMVRKMLSEGKPLPDHFGRKEALSILGEYYKNLDQSKKVSIKLQKFATGDAMK
ncbi:Sulfate adenylyltransferase [Entamoeba marina]